MYEIRACLLYDSLNIKGDVSGLEPDYLVGLSHCLAQATRVFAPAHGVGTQLDHGDNLVLTHPSAKTKQSSLDRGGMMREIIIDIDDAGATD